MTKTGIVTQVNKNIVYLMTSGGEFVKVKAKGGTPSVGEIFCGEAFMERKIFRLPAVAAAMLSFIMLSSGFYTYYTPVAAITIDINPSVALHINRWNRIIKASPLNEDGKKVLSNLSLANKSPEQGLELIVAQAEKDNYINEDYKASDKVISVRVVEKKEDQINLSGFQAAVEKQNLKVSIKEDIKYTKEAVKQNIKETNKVTEDLGKNQPNASDIENSKTEGSDSKNKGQENKDAKAELNQDKSANKNEDKSQSSKDNTGNNSSNSDKEDKKETSDQKKEDKILDKEEDKKDPKKNDIKENKDSKSNNGNASGNSSKNEKGNKKE
jgi:hypothetical protein